jgi:integrase
MRLYKRSGIYYLTYQSTTGKQVRKSLNTHDKQIAEQKRAKLELDLHEARLFGKEPARSFKELIVNYLESKQHTRGFRRLQYACKALLGHFEDSDVTQLRESHIEQYVALRSKTVSHGTIRREVGTLSAAFNHVIKKHNWQIGNPCSKAEKPKNPNGRTRYLTHTEVTTLLRVSEVPVDPTGRPLTSQFKSPVLRDFIELALNTGCRKGELLNLRWEHVDFSARLLYLETTKSGNSQTVPINEAARQVLVRRQRLRADVCPDTPWVFFHITPTRNTKVGDRVKDVRKSFSTACSRAGIENFRIHDLRHTFASWLVREGVPLYEVSKLLRHSSIQMTERYTHLAPDHLHDAVANLGFSTQFQHTEKPRRQCSTRMT